MTPVDPRRAPVDASALMTADPPTFPPGPARITVHTEEQSVVLLVESQLDDSTGSSLVSAARAAVASHAERIAIDLRQLQAWTEGGARALVECREVCSNVPGGLHYRTGRGPGRDALLAAYS